MQFPRVSFKMIAKKSKGLSFFGREEEITMLLCHLLLVCGALSLAWYLAEKLRRYCRLL